MRPALISAGSLTNTGQQHHYSSLSLSNVLHQHRKWHAFHVKAIHGVIQLCIDLPPIQRVNWLGIARALSIPFLIEPISDGRRRWRPYPAFATQSRFPLERQEKENQKNLRFPSPTIRGIRPLPPLSRSVPLFLLCFPFAPNWTPSPLSFLSCN